MSQTEVSERLLDGSRFVHLVDPWSNRRPCRPMT